MAVAGAEVQERPVPTAGDERARLQQRGVEAVVVADAHAHAGRGRCFAQPEQRLETIGAGFLDEHVLAGGDGAVREERERVVGRRDEHQVDVGRREELGGGRGDADGRGSAGSRRKVVRALRIDVVAGDEGRPGWQVRQPLPPDQAAADDADAGRRAHDPPAPRLAYRSSSMRRSRNRSSATCAASSGRRLATDSQRALTQRPVSHADSSPAR